MPRRQTYKQKLPKLWLMTDPRLDDYLLAAVRKLPSGSGVIFRHYQLPKPERFCLYQKVRRICCQRGHMLLLAGPDQWPADGVHGQKRRSPASILSMPVHTVREIAAAHRQCADLMFLSPVFATRSHPGARVLGIAQFSRLARLAHPAKVIALGGMTRNTAQTITDRIAYGWAAIDAFKL
jgi:thiamine-phosphate pyrophosphorylase